VPSIYPFINPLTNIPQAVQSTGSQHLTKPISTTAIPNYSSTSSQTKTFPQEIPGKKQKKLAKSRRISQRRKKRELKQACKTKRISAQQAAFHLKKALFNTIRISGQLMPITPAQLQSSS
jgi:hypothetical protein